MTKAESGGKSDTKSGKTEKERSSKRSHRREKQKPPTKIVIRHLPPTMTEEEFLKQIDPLPPHDFYYFAAADWSLGYDATCRAYITMKNYDDVFLFRDRFDGYVFVDSKGAEYPAIVEFAPFQGLVKNKSRRVDNKVNTIEQEAHYQQFIAKLEEEREAAKNECKLEFSLDRKKEEKITSTPLLQYLANKKEKRREEAKRRQEEKRRQREEDKEKRKQTQTQHQVTKIISNHDGGGGGGGAASAGGKSNNKSAGGKENVAAEKNNQPHQHEEGKSTRSQRRAERNQRRREEFERRRQEREQRDKGTDGKTKTDNEAEPKETEKKVKEQPQPAADKPDEGKQQQRKEGGKRYSERRERDRNRNRKDKEKDNQKDAAPEEITKTEDQKAEAIKETTPASTAGAEAIVNESVMNFIRSVATAKEFVPKHKLQELEDLQKKSSDEAVATTNEEKVADTKPAVEETKKSDSNAENDTRIQKQRTADEQRRIRNKDRPSIAIYQPKPRLRMSEERDASASRPQPSKSDTRSNPTSDCESLKKEETRGKKVSRYSERRAERRNNKEKQKQNTDSIEPESKQLQPEQKEDSVNTVEQPKSNEDKNNTLSNNTNPDVETTDKDTEKVNNKQTSD